MICLPVGHVITSSELRVGDVILDPPTIASQPQRPSRITMAEPSLDPQIIYLIAHHTEPHDTTRPVPPSVFTGGRVAAWNGCTTWDSHVDTEHIRLTEGTPS